MARHTHHDTEIATKPRRNAGRRWPEPQTAPNRSGQLQLSVVRSVARRALVPGVVVLAHVPYEDEQHTSKLRPAVVTGVAGRNVTVLPATSAESRRRYAGRHCELVDPAAAGLLRATGIRLSEVTLDLVDMVAVIGRLGTEDEERLLHCCGDRRAVAFSFAA